MQSAIFKDKVIVIAGATGVVASGAVRAFLNEGAIVVGISRNAEKVEELKKAMSIGEDELFHAVIGDFNDEFEAVKTKERVASVLAGRPVDHVISSIGFTTKAEAPTKTDIELAREAFDNGFFNTVLVAQSFLPDLKINGGSYTMVSGGLAHGLPLFVPNVEQLWLVSAKNAAVNALTYGLHAETMHTNARVNTLCIHFGVAPVGGNKNQMGMPAENNTLALAPVFLEVAKGSVRGEVICLNNWEDVGKAR